MTAPAVEVCDLTRRFGRFAALDGASFRVDEGEVYGLLGLNGAGKTTTLRILSTLLAPTSGSASVLGHDVAREPAAVRRVLGIVSEDSGRSRLDWRVPHYLEYFGRIHGHDRAETRKRAAPLLARLLPRDFHAARLDTLSGGMRKKVEITRALISRPRLLLLDEPTKDLDIPSKEELWAFLRERASEDGLTVLLTSHDALEIEALCERICVLRAGKVAHEGPTRDFERGAEFQRAVARLLA